MKKKLIILLAVLLMVPLLSSAQTTSGLVDYYPFDNGSAADTAGSNSGTVSGATSVAGRINGGLQFNGSGNVTTSAGILSGLSNVTISMWVYWTGSASSVYGLFGQGDPSSSSFMEIDAPGSNGNDRLFFRGTSNQDWNFPNPLVLNSWTLLTIVRTTSGISLYKNGTLLTSTSIAGGPITAATGFQIGGLPAGSGGAQRFANGIIDDVRIYNRALDATEVAGIYSGGGSAPSPVNGSCSATVNMCSVGTFSDQTDTQTQALWQCLGSNGGTNASCSAAISQNPTPVNGVCGVTVNSCSAGTFSDQTDSQTQYLWQCTGANGGTTAACTSAITQTTGPVKNVGPGQTYTKVGDCLRVVQPGDTCMIHAGDYTSEGPLSLSASGSAGNYITIQAYPGDHPIIQRILVNGNYVKIVGLEISKSQNVSGQNSGVHVLGSNNQVLNNHFYGGYTADPGSTAIFFNGNNNLAQGNLVEGNFADNSSFWIPFWVYPTAQNNSFIGNIARNLTDVERVWEGVGYGTYIANNEVYSIRWSGDPGVHPDIFQVVGDTNDSSNVTIENNYFHDLDMQIGINESLVSKNWIMRNNVFANITQRMMLTVPGMKVYNNTFYNVSSQVQNVMDGWATGVEYKNNIIIGRSTDPDVGVIAAGPMGTFTQCASEGGTCSFSGLKDIVFQNSQGDLGAVWKRNVPSPQACTVANFGSDPNQYYPKTCSYKDPSEVPISNNYYATPTGGARNVAKINRYGDINFINGGDPKFVAAYTDCVANVCDFRLQSTSPLINKGVTLPGFSTDKNGTTRTGTWDLGAYESGSGGGGSNPPPIVGDFNNDGAVNSIDLSLMAGAWNTTNATYDLNGDGRVNTLDYVIMVRNWTN